MFVKFNGALTAGWQQSGDAISQIEIVWKAGSEDEAAAISAGRTVTLTTAEERVAFLDTGIVKSCGSLVSGTTYTPAVRVTETRSSGTGTGAWTAGSTFSYTVLSAPTIGTATASTKTLTWSAVTNAVGYQIAISTDSGATYPTTIIVGAVTSNVFTTMTASTYRYKVASISTVGAVSAYSSVATAA